MGPAGSEREATDDEVAAMARLLGTSLDEGGLGFSSSWAATHNDEAGEPVPSRYATEGELLALLLGQEHGLAGRQRLRLPLLHQFLQGQRLRHHIGIGSASQLHCNFCTIAVATLPPDDLMVQSVAP